jgi:UDP-N-acetylmuramoyl-tripeptide--D-alanyl-D-alanine ligase
MSIEKLHTIFLKFPKVCTDTRKITKDCIFFALKGEHFDGNKFASEALQNGASYAVIDKKEYAVSQNYILVDDTLEALQELANYHRNHNKAKIIALTGSNGKTTTKELINAVLSKKYKTVATIGNLNNHIGVPLTLLGIRPETEIAVVEMGANHLKEIAFLCQIAQPDFGYITNFGKAHLEGFGGEAGVIKGKSELYDYLKTHKKSIFLNADDLKQTQVVGNYIEKFGFSQEQPQYYKIEFLGAHPFVTIKVEDIIIYSHLIGSYNYTNCAAAILMGKYFNVPLGEIKDALEKYVPNNNRSQILDKNGYQIVLDAYNANPSSMKAALDNFAVIGNSVKIAVLGDMFELGKSAALEHQKIADLAAQMKFDDVLLVGKNFFGTESRLKKFDSFDSLSAYLKDHKLKKGLVLIKGSRGMALERVLELL